MMTHEDANKPPKEEGPEEVDMMEYLQRMEDMTTPIVQRWLKFLEKIPGHAQPAVLIYFMAWAASGFDEPFIVWRTLRTGIDVVVSRIIQSLPAKNEAHTAIEKAMSTFSQSSFGQGLDENAIRDMFMRTQAMVHLVHQSNDDIRWQVVMSTMVSLCMMMPKPLEFWQTFSEQTAFAIKCSQAQNPGQQPNVH